MEFQEIDNVGALKRSGFYRLRFGGPEISVRFKRGTADGLIVVFHGAVNRQTRTIPCFQPFLPNVGGFHQLTISDATLELSDSLRAGWYAGGRCLRLQDGLVETIAKVSDRLGSKRRIYVGGSAGGFAALYCSYFDSDSVCVAANPQVDLKAYLPSAVAAWLDAAWPGAESVSDIEGQVCLRLGELYAGGFKNLVVYLQSCGDDRHFSGQLPGFFNSAIGTPDRFILQCGYYGIPGHSNSVPSSVYYPWVQAAVLAPSSEKQALLDAYHQIVSAASVGPSSVGSTSPEKTRAFSAQDLLKADLLRDLQLAHDS
ncbi:hypothetical protein [Rubellimicrobium mesophilum]|uniref:hypothetical protein n=1 Tax=Rubellimicrobium mesophilum TaxID=1123067 RepID=UPI0012E1FB5E|nr:hypothetical protein [Rubellimicrobium mesophilum]